MNKSYFSLLVISIWAASALSAFADVDPNTLFQQALLLESKGENAQALTLYQEVISEYPDDLISGPDNAGFRVKYVAGLLASEKGDIAALRENANQIKSLNASPKQKPDQLYSAGLLFESAGLLQDALSAYQQVISEYPDDTASGSERAGFRVKLVAGFLAMEKGDVAAVREDANQIRSLNASPQQKPDQLYSAGYLFEIAGFYEDALAIYQQVISQYPNDAASGPDEAGFHVKYVAGILALRNSDAVAVRTLAAEIRLLNALPQQKPNQLFAAGFLLEAAGFWQDALSIYQQVISEYPDSSVAQTTKIHNDGVELIKNISDGNLAAAIAGTSELKAKYADAGDELTTMLFVIGEAYYLAGMKNNQSEFLR